LRFAQALQEQGRQRAAAAGEGFAHPLAAAAVGRIEHEFLEQLLELVAPQLFENGLLEFHRPTRRLTKESEVVSAWAPVDSVAFDIAHHREQVPIVLDGKSLESPLTQMAAGTVMTMIPPHVRGEQPLHPAPQVAIALGPQDQVNF
jgi:hypothetical protein